MTSPGRLLRPRCGTCKVRVTHARPSAQRVCVRHSWPGHPCCACRGCCCAPATQLCTQPTKRTRAHSRPRSGRHCPPHPCTQCARIAALLQASGGPCTLQSHACSKHPCFDTHRTQPPRWKEGSRGTGWRLPLVALVPLIGGNIPARDKGGGRVLLGSWGGASGQLPPVLRSTFASGARAPEGAEELIMCWHPEGDM